MSKRPHSERVERIQGIVDNLRSDSGIDKRLLRANVGIATLDESSILDDIFSLIGTATSTNASEIFRGAHVHINDGGYYYRCWRHLHSREDRPSSHDSDEQEYEVAGPCCHAILVGIVANYTWFQMENSSYHANKIDHGIDYLNYWNSSRNQGPYGSSAYTDKNWLSIQGTTDDD